MRTDIDPGELGHGGFSEVLTSVVVPRPIAWVSARSAAGVDDLAPHSFCTVACASPPMVQFTSVGRKDSLRNVLETGARGTGLPAIGRLRPLARLGRTEWATIGEVLDITRIPYEQWPGHFRREG